MRKLCELFFIISSLIFAAEATPNAIYPSQTITPEQYSDDTTHTELRTIYADGTGAKNNSTPHGNAFTQDNNDRKAIGFSWDKSYTDKSREYGFSLGLQGTNSSDYAKWQGESAVSHQGNSNSCQKALTLNYLSYLNENFFFTVSGNYFANDSSHSNFDDSDSTYNKSDDFLHNYTHTYALGAGLGRIYQSATLYKAKRVEEILLENHSLSSVYSDEDLEKLASLIAHRETYKTTYPEDYDAYFFKDLTVFIITRDNYTGPTNNGYVLYKALDSVQNEFIFRAYNHGTRLNLYYQAMHSYNRYKYTYKYDDILPVHGEYRLAENANINSGVLQLSDSRILGWRCFLTNLLSYQEKHYAVRNTDYATDINLRANRAADIAYSFVQKGFSGAEILTYQYAQNLDVLLSWEYATYTMPLGLDRDFRDSAGYYCFYPILTSNKNLGLRYYITNNFIFIFNYMLSDNQGISFADNSQRLYYEHNQIYSWALKNYF